MSVSSQDDTYLLVQISEYLIKNVWCIILVISILVVNDEMVLRCAKLFVTHFRDAYNFGLDQYF